MSTRSNRVDVVVAAPPYPAVLVDAEPVEEPAPAAEAAEQEKPRRAHRKTSTGERA